MAWKGQIASQKRPVVSERGLCAPSTGRRLPCGKERTGTAHTLQKHVKMIHARSGRLVTNNRGLWMVHERSLGQRGRPFMQHGRQPHLEQVV